jgi:hypothetical protein
MLAFLYLQMTTDRMKVIFLILFVLFLHSCDDTSTTPQTNNDTSPHVMNTSALLFDGQTKIEVPHAPALDLAGASYTIQAWVKVGRLTDYYQDIVVKGTTAPNVDYDAGINYQNRFHFLANRSELSLVDTTIAIPGFYYHYAVVVDTVTKKATLYINGDPRVSADLAGTPTKVENRLLIGGHNTESLSVHQNWNGIIYNLSIWKKAKTAAEVKESMYQRLHGDEAGLVACWFIDEGSGTTVKELTGKHNGTILGSATWVNMPY